MKQKTKKKINQTYSWCTKTSDRNTLKLNTPKTKSIILRGIDNDRILLPTTNQIYTHT